ncbi:MAG: hypothetical protein NZM07_09615 [Elioraea sp.]|nr:hypothetical protein [Elioraea sp.]
MAAAGGELPGREAVADEQVADDPADLLPVHQEEAAPAAFEFEETFRFRVGLEVDIGVFAEPGVARREALEVQQQVRAVELAVAEVGEQERRRGAARQPAQVAHRILAALAGPVGEGGALRTKAPTRPGAAEASIIVAHPPWQLPITTGFGARGCRSSTVCRNTASAAVTSRMVCPSTGLREKTTNQTG